MADPAFQPLDIVEQIIRSRRATRHFRPDPLPDGLLPRLLDAARWAPSGYNLQPLHMVVVADPALKPALHRACMNQVQVLEAPATVVFTGDSDAFHRNAERTLTMDREDSAINAQYESLLRRVLPLAFRRGPLGLSQLWKTLLPPLGTYAAPIPSIPAADMGFWLAKQVSLAAMNFMLAATAAGLATVPMEGFDERRVRRVLGVPRRVRVILVVPVGYAADATLRKTRLPLAEIVHTDRW